MIINLFDNDASVMVTAAQLMPAEAARHAHDFEPKDLEELSDDALLAVARVRPLRCRLRPAPPPFMPRPDRRRAAFVRH